MGYGLLTLGYGSTISSFWQVASEKMSIIKVGYRYRVAPRVKFYNTGETLGTVPESYSINVRYYSMDN